MNAKELSSAPAPLAYSKPEHLVRDFASRGLVVLALESLGISLEIHERIYQREKQAVGTGERVTPELIPDVLEVINAPGVVAACNQLVGENWAIVPFTHNATFSSGGRDQHWHKDDNGPFNGRKQRHHQAVQIEMLYYPQAVREDMGPTATVPYSHYWTFNHEENHDNFARADHLDFAYQLSGMEGQPVSGPDSQYDRGDIVHRRTAHDVRLREAVTNLKWPLVQSFEVAPLRTGSVVLYSHNTFHRGNHRRDDWRTWEDNPRFMYYRPGAGADRTGLARGYSRRRERHLRWLCHGCAEPLGPFVSRGRNCERPTGGGLGTTKRVVRAVLGISGPQRPQTRIASRAGYGGGTRLSRTGGDAG